MKGCEHIESSVFFFFNSWPPRIWSNPRGWMRPLMLWWLGSTRPCTYGTWHLVAGQDVSVRWLNMPNSVIINNMPSKDRWHEDLTGSVFLLISQESAERWHTKKLTLKLVNLVWGRGGREKWGRLNPEKRWWECHEQPWDFNICCMSLRCFSFSLKLCFVTMCQCLVLANLM